MFISEHDQDITEAAHKDHDGASEIHQPSMAGVSQTRARASANNMPVVKSHGEDKRTPGRKSRMFRGGTTTRWRVLAAGSALLLTLLTIGGIYLITKRPSTVDQVVILTVPSGADIKLDSKEYGHSPVKLEQVPMGTYTLTITKDGFEPIVQQITVSDSQPLEYRLRPLLMPEAIGLSREEQIRQFTTGAEQAFERKQYGIPYEGSALFYVDSILGLDQSSEFALNMREEIRKTLHKSAQTAIARGDSAQALEIYETLVNYYNTDEEARASKARLETQLALRQGEVRDLVRKAEDALRAGNLTEPARASAYYYSKQALAIDKQNAQARAVRNTVKDQLMQESERELSRGNTDQAIRQLDQITQLFPEDRQIRTRARELANQRATEQAKQNDPNTHRLNGLAKVRRGEYAEAIRDLEYAVENGRGTPDVISALAQSHLRLGHLDQASHYFGLVPATSGDEYVSAIATLGDIALRRGDSATAVEQYRKASRLGGSTLYQLATLEEKIERIERKQREKAAEPKPLTVQVRHLHGRLQGTCSGTLTISSTGVRYDGEHVFSSNVMGVNVRITKDKMIVNFSNKAQEFKASYSDAERFQETLNRYQSPATQ